MYTEKGLQNKCGQTTFPTADAPPTVMFPNHLSSLTHAREKQKN